VEDTKNPNYFRFWTEENVGITAYSIDNMRYWSIGLDCINIGHAIRPSGDLVTNDVMQVRGSGGHSVTIVSHLTQ
jgi:hypothetical protein